MDFFDAIVISDSLRNLKEGYCCRDDIVRHYTANTGGRASMEALVRAATKCGCPDCETALQRYAHDAMKQFGKGQ